MEPSTGSLLAFLKTMDRKPSQTQLAFEHESRTDRNEGSREGMLCMIGRRRGKFRGRKPRGQGGQGIKVNVDGDKKLEGWEDRRGGIECPKVE